MRRRPFTLVQPENSQAVHIKVLHGKTACGLIFDSEKATKVKPLAVPVRDLCPDCMTGHFRRRKK